MKFLAVDLSSVFRRNWEAAEGESFAQARQRTIGKIQREADGFDRIVVARDAPSFRYAVYPDYKKGRPDPGEAFREQMKLCIQDLREIAATVWVSPPWKVGDTTVFGEADDVIASFAMWYQELVLADDGVDRSAWELSILTGDRDLWALVDDELRISVRTLEEKLIKVDQVKESPSAGFGVSPEFVPEVKALSGDKSDGWDGFDGIGGLTAKHIIDAGLPLVQAGDAGPADPIFRLVLADKEATVKLTKTVVASIKAGGFERLKLGRTIAQVRPWLVAPKSDGERWDVMNFAAVLEEPKPVPRRRPQQPADAPPPKVEPQPAPATPAPSRALAIAEPAPMASMRDLPFAPQLNKMMRFAEAMFESGIFRMTLPNPAACLMVCEYARAFDVPAVILAQHTHVVKGRVSFGAQVLMAIVLRDKSTKAFRFTGNPNDPTVQRVKYHRTYPDGGEEKGVYEFTIEMARKAGFLDGKHSEQWAKRSPVMLGWAGARECAKKFWPDLTVGLPLKDDPEDEGDFPKEMEAELVEAA